MVQTPSSVVSSDLTNDQKWTCLDINQHLLFVRSSFLSSDFLYDVYFRFYGGSKEFHAINFRFLTPPPPKRAVSILRYSPRLRERSICMGLVLYWCEWTMEPRNGVFLQILGHFLRANVATKFCSKSTPSKHHSLASFCKYSRTSTMRAKCRPNCPSPAWN